MKKTLLTILAAISFSCAQKEVTPYRLDTQLNELREYKVTDRANLKIKYVKAHKLPRSKDGLGNNMWCFPPDQVESARNACLEVNCMDEFQIMLDRLNGKVQ